MSENKVCNKRIPVFSPEAGFDVFLKVTFHISYFSDIQFHHFHQITLELMFEHCTVFLLPKIIKY